MAQYRLEVKTIQRSAGRSVVAAAAYRSGSLLIDERLGMEFDFSSKNDIAHSEIMAPEGAPAALQGRSALWNAAEASERRKDAVPAQEVLLSLPHELTDLQRRELVRDFVREHLVAKGMIADINIHRPGKTGDDRNHHAHILVTTRGVGPSGFGRKDREWNHAQFVRGLREPWAEVQNEHLRRHLGPGAPQVSDESLAARGIDRDPTVHLGPEASALERKNVRSDRGVINRAVGLENSEKASKRRDYQERSNQAHDASPEIDSKVSALISEARAVRDEMVRDRDKSQAEYDQLIIPKIPSAKQIEREITAPAAAIRARAAARLERTEARVKETRSRRLGLVQWVRNPARMIWAKHAELNALASARADHRKADVELRVRQDWVRSPKGQALIAARREPTLEAAAKTKTQMRTLERNIKRQDKRLDTALTTFNDLRIAQELGHTTLRVKADPPDPTRMFRDLGQAARTAIQGYPAREQQQALERLRRGKSRTIVRGLMPDF
ncbi:MobQ family relaxase [Caulobacter sp. DWP3-1-3b2]|uniref:MobQ family relaxase n=1 Tax=Caulobacter sp. DWP3-1-3b2 TaxID=2804643 RepID=UPI003CE807DD